MTKDEKRDPGPAPKPVWNRPPVTLSGALQYAAKPFTKAKVIPAANRDPSQAGPCSKPGHYDLPREVKAAKMSNRQMKETLDNAVLKAELAEGRAAASGGKSAIRGLRDYGHGFHGHSDAVSLTRAAGVHAEDAIDNAKSAMYKYNSAWDYRRRLEARGLPCGVDAAVRTTADWTGLTGKRDSDSMAIDEGLSYSQKVGNAVDEFERQGPYLKPNVDRSQRKFALMAHDGA